jgi:lipopolysaccharide cholinephosphotransferase
MENNNQKIIKELQLKALIYIADLCKKNNLKYYLLGGTLLGAVRHKGFIPWDDDIDIGLVRGDYVKLTKILTNEINEDYFLQNFKTDLGYPRYITKLRVNGTKFIESYLQDYRMHHGVYIDIFPLDKTTLKSPTLIDFRVKLAEYLIKLRTVRNTPFNHGDKSKRIIAKIIRPFALIIPLSWINNFIDFAYTFENRFNCKYIINFSSQYGWRKQTFPINVYGYGTPVVFEGHEFMAPSEWKIILKSIYGDYMKLPPEEKRISGHHVSFVDLGKYKK